MEYFDDAWYKCRTGRDDVLRKRMKTLAGLRGHLFIYLFIFLKQTFSSLLLFSIFLSEDQH